MRKAHVTATVELVLWMDDGLELSEVMDVADITLCLGDGVTVESVDITDFNVTDSK